MSPCLSITREEIRASVMMGGVLLAETPFVTNISVNKSRSQQSGTFSVTFDILGGTSFPLGADLVVTAGTRNNQKTIFTGLVEAATSSPCFGKPSYFTVTLSGQGVLSKLKGKKFSRRLRTDGQGLYCLITSGPTNRPTSYYSTDKSIKAGNQSFIRNSPDPARAEGETSPVIRAPSSGGNEGRGGRPKEVAGSPQGGATGEGFRVHTHENMDQGGPAFGVYSPD